MNDSTLTRLSRLLWLLIPIAVPFVALCVADGLRRSHKSEVPSLDASRQTDGTQISGTDDSVDVVDYQNQYQLRHADLGVYLDDSAPAAPARASSGPHERPYSDGDEFSEQLSRLGAIPALGGSGAVPISEPSLHLDDDVELDVTRQRAASIPESYGDDSEAVDVADGMGTDGVSLPMSGSIDRYDVDRH